MENSLNSSNSESTISRTKNIFKKPTNFYQAFEVSLEESVTGAQSSKLEPDLDISTGGQKKLPFKKSRKYLQQRFSVSLNDSASNNDSEQSVTVGKVQSIFKNKNKSLMDFFNVSYNETIGNLQPDVLEKSNDETNDVYFKKNPFKKNTVKDKVDHVTSINVSHEENDKSSLESPRQSPQDVDDGTYSTTFITKENPFKKTDRQEDHSSSQLQLSVTDENQVEVSRQEDHSSSQLQLSVTDENQVEVNKSKEVVNQSSTTNTSRLNNEPDLSSVKSKSNPFEQKNTLQSGDLMISVTEERSNKSAENGTFIDPKRISKNISVERSILKSSSNTASFFEQSSINDENLNNWMSDQSDEEMPPPRIPSVTSNLSPTKEKPPVPDSPVVNKSSLSIWEQKFNEIISNVGKKRLPDKTNLDPNCISKPKILKKPDLNTSKPNDEENKYKPPKLIKPASFATKKLYAYIMKRLEPKYGIDTVIESENLVLSICDTVKKVTRRKSHQKKLIQNLKKEMAEAGLIETTMDFYEFVIKFLPYSFRVKVVPCLQPVTNMVYPPKDVVNPFDKIL